MILSNRAFDLAELRTEQEREAAIADAGRALAATGTLQCADCGSDIPPARRMALPSATRCVACQTDYEHEGLTK